MTSAKLKKILTWTTIGCIIAAGLVAILYLVNCSAEFIKLDETIQMAIVKPLLTLLTLFLASLFILNIADSLCKKNILSFISVGLILVSALFFFITIWGSMLESPFFKATVAIASITILFNTIVGNILSIGKRAIGLQIPSYIFLFAFGLIINLLVFGVIEELSIIIITVLSIIFVAWGVMAIILSIRKKAILNSMKAETPAIPADYAPASDANAETVVLTKQEYQELLDKIAYLEDQLNNK